MKDPLRRNARVRFAVIFQPAKSNDWVLESIFDPLVFIAGTDHKCMLKAESMNWGVVAICWLESLHVYLCTLYYGKLPGDFLPNGAGAKRR